jgi:hypothetical protein
MPVLRARSGSRPCGSVAIDDGGDFDAGADEPQRRPVRAVVVGEDDGARVPGCTP